VEALEGVYFTYPQPDLESESGRRFAQAYKSKHNETPALEACYGYDLILLISSSLKNGLQGDNRLGRLQKVTSISGAFGPTPIPADRDIKTAISIAVTRNGMIENLATVKP
jgi:hypothetical protein